MQSLYRRIGFPRAHNFNIHRTVELNVSHGGDSIGIDRRVMSSMVSTGKVAVAKFHGFSTIPSTHFLPSILSKFAFCPALVLHRNITSEKESISSLGGAGARLPFPVGQVSRGASFQNFTSRFITTEGGSLESSQHDASPHVLETAPRLKFKRPDKTARHIMQIIDKEAVEDVKAQREIPDIRPGHIIQLKVEVPENKRRTSIVKGIVIARRNAGLNTTFRLRRQVAGVGVESLFLLYSPNIKEIKVLDKKKVRRAKLYYLRDKMNALKGQ